MGFAGAITVGLALALALGFGAEDSVTLFFSVLSTAGTDSEGLLLTRSAIAFSETEAAFFAGLTLLSVIAAGT